MLATKPVATQKRGDQEKQDLISDPISFLTNFKEHAAHHIQNAYEMEHTGFKASDGTLTTSLAGDVLSLIETQRSILWDFMKESELIGTEAGMKLFEEGSIFILACLKASQLSHRLVLLTSLEDSCASANNFLLMSERIEIFVRELFENYLSAVAPKSRKISRTRSGRSSDNLTGGSTLRQLGDALVDQFSQDAVYAAERAHVFILRTVQQDTSIQFNLFSKAWEDDWTHNETAQELVNIFHDYLFDIRRYLCNEYLYHKTLIISARAMVCFYIRCLVYKAESIGRSKLHPGDFFTGKHGKPFSCPKRALIRMRDDIGIMTAFFEEKAGDNQALSRMIRSEILTLEVIHECLGSTNDAASLESFILVIHKRTGADSLVTRHLVGDLCLLAAQESREDMGGVKQTLDQLRPDLQMVTTSMNMHRHAKVDNDISFVRVDEMLKVLYEDRIAHGLLPVCWTCLPKNSVQDSDESVLARQIRNVTRNVAELRFKNHTWLPRGKAKSSASSSPRTGVPS